MGRFTIYHDLARPSEFRWHLKDNNYEIILKSSEGYTTKQNCLNSIASVKVNAPFDNRYQRKSGTSGYYFTLHAANGETLGQSEYYVSAYNRDLGIENCKSEAPTAPINDDT